MTYPPPGGHDPQQYHVSSQQPPQQPNDPYTQGYSAPPPAGYGHDPNQYPPQPPNMTPPLGVHPGYPQDPHGSPLPPPIPPAKQGSNLGIILGVVVVLVVLLGVAAVLIVPGMLEDDDKAAQSGDDTTSEPAEESSSPEEESPTPEETQETEDPIDDTGGSFDDWGTPVNSENFDPNTPEGAGISWDIAVDIGDMDALSELMCSNPTDDMLWEYEYELEYNSASKYEFLIWGIAEPEQNGEVKVWAGWTMDDTPPTSEEDISIGGQYYTAVEEDGVWKLCDTYYW